MLKNSYGNGSRENWLSCFYKFYINQRLRLYHCKLAIAREKLHLQWARSEPAILSWWQLLYTCTTGHNCFTLSPQDQPWRDGGVWAQMHTLPVRHYHSSGHSCLWMTLQLTNDWNTCWRLKTHTHTCRYRPCTSRTGSIYCLVCIVRHRQMLPTARRTKAVSDDMLELTLHFFVEWIFSMKRVSKLHWQSLQFIHD